MDDKLIISTLAAQIASGITQGLIAKDAEVQVSEVAKLAKSIAKEIYETV